MTPQEYLSQYRELDNAINAKIEEANRIRDKAYSVPSCGGGSSGGGSDRVGVNVAKYLDLVARINADIDKLYELRLEIEEQIKKIPVIRYRTVLELKYFSGLSLEEIAERFNCDRSTVCRQHGTALTFINPQKILKNETLCNK